MVSQHPSLSEHFQKERTKRAGFSTTTRCHAIRPFDRAQDRLCSWHAIRSTSTTIAPLLRYRQIGLDLEEKGHTRFIPNDTWTERQH